MILFHGWPKLQNPEKFAKFLEQKGFFWPVFMAYVSIGAETLFPAMIILGFSTRFSSFITALDMFVAVFVYHIIMNGDPAKVWEKPLIYMFVFLLITITGPGEYSIDHSMSKGKTKTRWRIK